MKGDMMALKGRKLSYQERWSHLNPPGKTAFAGPKGDVLCAMRDEIRAAHQSRKPHLDDERLCQDVGGIWRRV